MSNKNTYKSAGVVYYYSVKGSAENLQKPEQAILNKLKDRIKNAKMLDIGVGGGRTTLHFADLVSEYVGVDYAENMIEACKKRFNQQNNISFKVADARDLKEFKDNSFDFVLFSYNGLGSINHDDRIKALKEIKRVLKNEGVFVFSSHNLNSIDKLFSIKLSKNPIKLAWRILRFCVLFILNGSPKKLKKKKWAIINDGAHNFRLRHYYITPFDQIQQLKELNYRNIQAFSLDVGQEIEASNLKEINDSWIYYVCDV